MSDTSDEGSELLHTVSIEAVDPIFHVSHVYYMQPSHGLPDVPIWDAQTNQRHVSEANVVTLIRCTSECELEVLELVFTTIVSAKGSN